MDLVVYKDADQFIARDAWANTEVAKAAKASDLFDKVTELLADGGTVRLASATYELDRPIRLPSRVTLTGSGRTTILKPKDIAIHAEGEQFIVVENLACHGPGHDVGGEAGVLFHDCGDSEIRNVHARDFQGCGIVIRNRSFMCYVTNTSTCANGRAGLLLDELTGGGRIGDFVPSLVVGCRSYGEVGHGFEIKRSLCCNLVGCSVFQCQGDGFHLHACSNSTCISGCRVFEALGCGVRALNTHELNVSSSIFCWNKDHAIDCSRVFWGTVSANELIDSGGTEGTARHGVLLRDGTRSVTVSANAIFNWDGHQPMICGVYETQDCLNNHVADNTIHYYSDRDVVMQGSGSTTADNVSMSDAYHHPQKPDRDHKKVTREFTRDRIEQFLDDTRI